MKEIGRLMALILLGVNAVASIFLLLSAYSPLFDAHTRPVWSSIGLLFPVFLVINLLFLLFWVVVYRRYALFPLLAFLACWGTIRTYLPINLFEDDVPENAIKILSYNTRAFGLKASHTKEKSNEVLQYLQESDADIICLQEYIWGGGLKKKDIDYALRKYRYKHYHPIAGGQNGLGVYSRFPILSATPIKYKSKLNGSIAYQIKVDGDTLSVINNHLESNKIMLSDVETYQDMVDAPDSHKLLSGTRKLLKKMGEATAIRARQTDALLRELEKRADRNVVVCGDFNDTPVSYTHHAFHQKLKDAFVETGNGLGISYHLNRLYFRIDHIFLSQNLKVYDCTVDNATKASDHYPVWCYISLD